MLDEKLLYRFSLLEAKRSNEVDLWRESQQANIECKNAIEKAIAVQFDGMHLMDNTAKIIYEEYGIDRVNWVLANTIQNKDYDGRFSSANKEWAKGFYIPTGNAKDHNSDFVVNSHPAVLDGLVSQARKEYDKLNLFDRKHCEENSRDLDFQNEVLVLNPEVLRDEYKNPDDQLFYANGGFGCSPTANGRKVYGQFIKDGEEMNYNRTDFIGVIKNEFLPGWAREKLQELNPPVVDQEHDDGMTMQ